jgi:hypothetical protein
MEQSGENTSFEPELEEDNEKDNDPDWQSGHTPKWVKPPKFKRRQKPVSDFITVMLKIC